LNALLGGIRNSFQQEQRFNANVAHELRTPLAGFQSRTDTGVIAVSAWHWCRKWATEGTATELARGADPDEAHADRAVWLERGTNDSGESP